MLFNTDDLNTDYNTRNTLNLLESMYRIDRVWAKHTPASVPLMESKEYGAFIARYSDLMKLSEEYDASIQECLDAVIYENHLRPNEVIVSLEEWRPYVDPLILHRFSNNYVLVPEINTPAYRLCEVCMKSFLETGDYIWLDVYYEAPEGTYNNLEGLMEEYYTEGAGVADDLNSGMGVAADDDDSTVKNIIRDQEKKRLESRAKNKIAAQKHREAQMQKRGETAEQRKERIKLALQAREYKRAFKLHDELNGNTQQITNNQNNNEPGWFAQKWTALKNWWNNAGQADSNGNVGWFSNLVGGFKNLLGIGKPREVHVDPKTGAEMAGNALMNTVKSMQPAQPAEKAEAEKKQAEETAKQKAANAAEQANNDQKQKENQTAPTTAPAQPTDNKPAAPATTA